MIQNECDKIIEPLDNTNNITYAHKAKEYFTEGYNCAQSVFLAFNDLLNIEFDDALKLSSSFGGGMGRLREVCGAVSSMFMVAGMVYGYTDPKDQTSKTEHYKRIQYLANQFEEKNHSLICRELLGLEKGKDNPTPELRTDDYYNRRPCSELVEMAAGIMENYIKENEKCVNQDSN